MHYMRQRRHGDATAKFKPGRKPQPQPQGDIATLQARIVKLERQLRRGTITMSRRDKMKIIKCLHPDKRGALNRLSDQEQKAALNEALQLFTSLNIREP